MIYTNIETMNNKHLPHGLASIVAVLKEFDHKVNFLYFETRVSKKELLEKLSHFRFDLIGISATTSQWYIVKKYPGWIKTKYRGVKIIFGGTHPTVCPSEVMAVKGVDMVCVGEGELPMLNLCNAMEKGHDYSGIESLWIKRRGFGLSKIIKNKVMHLVKDLDTFPLPDREFFDYNDLLLNHSYEGYEREAQVKKGRGCAFRCAYCSNSILRNIYPNREAYVRSRSVANVIEELRYLTSAFPVIKSFHFEDDTFTLNKRWVKQFCDEYKERIHMPFRIYINPLTVDYDLLKGLKEAGLYEVSIGVECGNEDYRKKVLRRNIANERIVQVFHWLHTLRIRSFALMIIGFPDETKEMIKESMDFIKRLVPFHTQIVVYYPYPANPLYQYCKDNHLLTRKTKTTIFHGESSLKLKHISKIELRTLYDDFWRLSFELREKWHNYPVK